MEKLNKQLLDISKSLGEPAIFRILVEGDDVKIISVDSIKKEKETIKINYIG